MRKSVLAIAAHPDDIEFVMAGTLLRLIEQGWSAHYFDIANGCCGSMEMDRETCAATRLVEAKAAAAGLPASFYPPIRNDMEVFYDQATHAEVTAVVRRAKPSIILTHAPSDYMEDHQNAARLAVSGAFVRGTPNFRSTPSVEPYFDDVAVYHAQPHGNRNPLGVAVTPSHCIDVSELMARKRDLLSCHQSQKAWLDSSQGMDSYLQTMEDLNAAVGNMSGRFAFAEGWRQHIHVGLSGAGFDPLADALSNHLQRLPSADS